MYNFIITSLQNALYEAFSPFGLLYEVLVFPVSKSQIARSTSKQNDDSAAYYAFVKFYSYHAAQRARVTLAKTLKLGSQFCKVRGWILLVSSEPGIRHGNKDSHGNEHQKLWKNIFSVENQQAYFFFL